MVDTSKDSSTRSTRSSKNSKSSSASEIIEDAITIEDNPKVLNSKKRSKKTKEETKAEPKTKIARRKKSNEETIEFSSSPASSVAASSVTSSQVIRPGMELIKKEDLVSYYKMTGEMESKNEAIAMLKEEVINLKNEKSRLLDENSKLAARLSSSTLQSTSKVPSGGFALSKSDILAWRSIGLVYNPGMNFEMLKLHISQLLIHFAIYAEEKQDQSFIRFFNPNQAEWKEPDHVVHKIEEDN